jgi:protein SDA1
MLNSQMGDLLCLNLPQLQNLIKRDPGSYHDEFVQQYYHYQTKLSLFKLRLHEEDKELDSSLIFLSHVVDCYPGEFPDFPEDLMTLLEHHGTIIHPSHRQSFVKALMLLRSKECVKMER